MSFDLVSVIIPLYNQDKYIKEAIESVLIQTHTDLEIIVVDDGSTDRSADIVKSIKDPRVYYVHRQNSGLPAIARNHGLKLARGRWVAFLDHDDVWLPNKLEVQLKALQQDAEIKLISGNMEFYGDIATAGRPMSKYHQKSLFMFEELLVGNRLLTSTVMVDKLVIDEFNGFREDRDLLAIEDYDLWLRISQKYKVLILPQILAKYRVYSGSTSGGRIRQLNRLENYLAAYLPDSFNVRCYRVALAKAKCHVFYNYASLYLKLRDERYRTYLKKVASIYPSRVIRILVFVVLMLPTSLTYLAFRSFILVKRLIR